MTSTRIDSARPEWTERPAAGALKLCLARPQAWLTVLAPSLATSWIAGAALYASGLSEVTMRNGAGPRNPLDAFLQYGLGTGWMAALVLSTLTWLMAVACLATLLVAYDQAYRGRSIDLADAARVVLRRISTVVKVNAAILGVEIVGLLPIALFLWYTSYALEIRPPSQGPPGDEWGGAFVVLVPLALMFAHALVPLALYALVKLSLVTPAAIIDGNGPRESVDVSWFITQRRVPDVFRHVFVVAVAWAFVSIVPYLPAVVSRVPPMLLLTWDVVAYTLVMAYATALFLLLWHKYNHD